MKKPGPSGRPKGTPSRRPKGSRYRAQVPLNVAQGLDALEDLAAELRRELNQQSGILENIQAQIRKSENQELLKLYADLLIAVNRITLKLARLEAMAADVREGKNVRGQLEEGEGK